MQSLTNAVIPISQLLPRRTLHKSNPNHDALGRFASGSGLLSLADNIDKILDGTAKEKTQLAGKHFKVCDTPSIMKQCGLTGDIITIKYGVISRHKDKDSDHSFTANEWRKICKALPHPFAITKSKEKDYYNVFLSGKKGNKDILVGMSVKSIGKNIEINAIRTVFAKDFDINDSRYKVLYVKNKKAPDENLLAVRHRSISHGRIDSIPPATQKSTLSWTDIEKIAKASNRRSVILCKIHNGRLVKLRQVVYTIAGGA